MEIVKDIIEQWKKLREIAVLNKANTINNNNERTIQDIIDFENKQIKDLI